jgi:hypothetical protein
MIQYLQHNEIDKTKWDEAIDHSVNKLIYANSWYLDIVCPGWNALVEDDYVSVMPLTAGMKYGTPYLYPPYFAQQLGIFSRKNISQEKAQEFLHSIPAQYKFMEVHLNTQNTFEFPGFQVKKNINIELSLNPSYETLHKKFSDDIKRNIKKAQKHGVVIKKDISPSSIVSIFRKNTGKKISNLSDKNYKTLLLLITTCIQKGFAETHGAFLNDKLCAGVVWLIRNNRAIFLFSATDPIAKSSGAMPFLINEFIKKHSGKDMILDFEGSNLPGLARFYNGFGSKENVYLQVRKNNLPGIIKWLKELKK